METQIHKSNTDVIQMKILHVITSLRTGGAEKLMVDLLPRLRDAGHEVDLCLFDGIETPFKSELQKRRIHIIEFSREKSVYRPLNIVHLRKLLKNYDIIHTHNYAPQIFAAIAATGLPIRLVTTEHGGSNRRRNYKFYATIDRWMYRRYDRVICIADKTKENLIAFVGKSMNNLCVVNNGVDIQRYAEAKSSDILEKTAPGSRKIMMVAGFRWEKDQDTLIHCLKYLPAFFHLFLVGDGVRRQELESLVKAENLSKRVHFMGVRSDVAELLHAADYIVMSSHFEGLSLSSVEGMSVGKPFLASDVDGLREVVAGAGILFPHQDYQALAAEIQRLESSPTAYNAVADACGRQATRYDISRMTEGYTKIYQHLTNN